MKNQKYGLVSIIIPTFNEESTIGCLLSSINRQTYPKKEVIIVDDQSSDQTVFVARNLGAKVYARKHAERSIQRNFGVSKSSGETLIFLDADMELLPGVIEDIVETMPQGYAAIVIPERTVGQGWIQSVRKFEREMYMGDPTIEVARVFKRDVFLEFGGYDPDLIGPEDYDLPYRISKKYKVGRSHKYILHHEENLTLLKLLKKKFYYAKKGALYAQKHPELISSQGNLLFRKTYFTNWRKFIKTPFWGLSFILVRSLETALSVTGYINSVGVGGFLNSLGKMLRLTKEK